MSDLVLWSDSAGRTWRRVLACAFAAASIACNHAPSARPGDGGGGSGNGGIAGQSPGGSGSSGIGGAGSMGGNGGAPTGDANDAGPDSALNVDGTGAVPGPDAGPDTAPDVTSGPVDAGAPVPIRALSIASGAMHNCALLEDHTVKCWGGNGAGQLGYGDTKARGNSSAEMGDALPRVDLGTGRTATAIAANHEHTCALLDDGSVKCWGSGRYLGLPDTTTRGSGPGQMGDALPALDLGAGRRATKIAAGYDTSCALLDDATLKCWGSQDPLDATATHMVPRTMTLGTTSKVRALLASGHGVALWLEDGKLFGELPGQPPSGMYGGAPVATYAGARQSRCALFVNGGSSCITAVGGQLPSTVRDVLSLGVGEDQNVCAIKTDGSVRCWGFEGSPATYWHDAVTMGAELQAGLRVLLPGKVTALASGGFLYMCALAADGRVWCWGSGAPPGVFPSPVYAPGSYETWSAVDLGSRR